YLAGKKTVVDELIAESCEVIRERAETLCTLLGGEAKGLRVVRGQGSVGGGCTPQDHLETFLVEIPVSDSESVARRLSSGIVPIFVLKTKKAICVDLRTVFAEEMESLVKGLQCLF